MCGIVGYLGTQQAQGILLDCLGRLDYRGYDSAGIAVIGESKLGIRRSVGRCDSLRKLLDQTPLPGTLGIAHTRWATHGRPTELNSHPHADCTGSLAVVHNGIVENYHELKRHLVNEGHKFVSDTDSEVIAHLVEMHIRGGEEELEAAVRKALTSLKGAYALAIISLREPNTMVVARSGGPPLVIGHGEDGLYISSDIAALLQYTNDVQVLENEEIAVISTDGAKVTMLNGGRVERARMRVSAGQHATGKNGFAHFMLKEIFEQPESVEKTIRAQMLLDNGGVAFPDAAFTQTEQFSRVTCITLVACGSSWHAALVGKYLLESASGVPVDVDIASEYRYRPWVDAPHRLVIGISQSGETADTLGALQGARQRGALVLGICNVYASSMSRDCDGVIYTQAGPEIGVASTKTFTCQLTALVMLAVSLARAKGKMPATDASSIVQELLQLPLRIQSILSQDDKIARLAGLFDKSANALYLGRGAMFPLALEGALKLKEISYIHAEGYPAGELKHGPIALIDNGLPVVVLATSGMLYDKVLSAIQEVAARGAMIIAIGTAGDDQLGEIVDHVFYLPTTTEWLMPILAAVPLQLLAYHIAVNRGCDVDKPRNLAKSVTVE